MPKEVVLKLLEEHEDTLTKPLQEVFARIKSMTCPNCGLSLIPKADLDNPFGDSHIPRYLGSCSECGYLIDPASKKDEPE